jgi:hypothetical protein
MAATCGLCIIASSINFALLGERPFGEFLICPMTHNPIFKSSEARSRRVFLPLLAFRKSPGTEVYTVNMIQSLVELHSFVVTVTVGLLSR